MRKLLPAFVLAVLWLSPASANYAWTFNDQSGASMALARSPSQAALAVTCVSNTLIVAIWPPPTANFLPRQMMFEVIVDDDEMFPAGGDTEFYALPPDGMTRMAAVLRGLAAERVAKALAKSRRSVGLSHWEEAVNNPHLRSSSFSGLGAKEHVSRVLRYCGKY